MSVWIFWVLIAALYAVAVLIGRRLGIFPIISQLLTASIAIPVLLLFWVEPHAGLDATALLSPSWLKLLYGMSFALLLGYILSDIVDLQLNGASIRIALPSFLVPFFAGWASAVWWLGVDNALGAIGIGLLFAITAIPVLYLYLRDMAYPPADLKRLMHAAILMDLMCWSLFGLAQGSAQPTLLIWPLLAAILPALFKLIGIRHPLAYSVPFFLLLLVLQQSGYNTLIFAIAYLLVMAGFEVRLQLPSERTCGWLLNGLAIPLILTYGVLQVDFHGAWQAYSSMHFLAMLALPVMTKLAGNWIGLYWAQRSTTPARLWRESVLLNIRGLTEIVFLNLLLQHELIDALTYFSLLLMSLFSTLMPAVLGIRRHPAQDNWRSHGPA
jgi:hypothetical protein